MSIEQRDSGQESGVNSTEPSNEQTGLSGCGKTILAYLYDDKIPNYNNFDGDTRNKYRLTALACGGATKGFSEFPPEGIDLKYFFAHIVEMVGKTPGEIIEACRIALIDKDEQVYSFVSDNLSRELDTLRSFFGNGPYTDPMAIRVKKVTTRNKMQTFAIEPVL